MSLAVGPVQAPGPLLARLFFTDDGRVIRLHPVYVVGEKAQEVIIVASLEFRSGWLARTVNGVNHSGHYVCSAPTFTHVNSLFTKLAYMCEDADVCAVVSTNCGFPFSLAYSVPSRKAIS